MKPEIKVKRLLAKTKQLKYDLALAQVELAGAMHEVDDTITWHRADNPKKDFLANLKVAPSTWKALAIVYHWYVVIGKVKPERLARLGFPYNKMVLLTRKIRKAADPAKAARESLMKIQTGGLSYRKMRKKHARPQELSY